MKNLPEAFLVEVFEACKRFEHHDAFAVREMLDEIGRCYQDGTPRVGNMLRLEEEIKPIWEQDPEVDLTYWFCCEKLGLSGGQADDLATCIYNGCRALKIEPHVLLAKGSVWVILIVHERLSRQQSATIAKLFDQFIQDRKKTSLSWMFATRPRRWSPLLVPPGLRQVVQFVRFLADELPPILLLNVRGVRPLVLNWLKRTEQHQHLKEWQLRTVYRGKDLGDDEWVQETYSLRYLICQDWTQWDDPELVNAVMKTVLQLPKKRRGCEFLEGRVGAELAYLYKAMNATMNVPQVDTIRELLQTSTLSPRALVRRLVTAFLELQTVEPKQEQLKMQPEDVPEGLILQPQDDSWRKAGCLFINGKRNANQNEQTCFVTVLKEFGVKDCKCVYTLGRGQKCQLCAKPSCRILVLVFAVLRSRPDSGLVMTEAAREWRFHNVVFARPLYSRSGSSGKF